MTSFPNSPQVVKGGLVLVDPESAKVLRVISLQYNPDTLTRTLQIPESGAGNARSEPFRVKSPPVETIKLEAEIDATDQLELPRENANTIRHGIQPALAALELIVYPKSSRLRANDALARSGTLEIAPMESPLTLFVWSKNRVIPVRLTELSVTEEAFDTALNPTRAKVNLGMRVLSVNDVGFEHQAGVLYMNYQQQKEKLAELEGSGLMSALGLQGLP